MGVFLLKNLKVRGFVGSDPHMKNNDRELNLNIELIYNSAIEQESDNIEDALCIKEILQEIVGRAENSHFNLIEAFTRMVLNTVLEFNRIEKASVSVMNFKNSQLPCEICFTLSDIKK